MSTQTGIDLDRLHRTLVEAERLAATAYQNRGSTAYDAVALRQRCREISNLLLGPIMRLAQELQQKENQP